MGEREQSARPLNMATTSTAVATVPPQLQEECEPRVAVITLRQTCAPQRERKKVVWTEDTVDNEHMNKKKSKCCCIYEKPRQFGESDSEDSEDECEHCFGHVENKHSKHHHHNQTTTPTPTSSITIVEDSTSTEPTLTVTLRADEPTPAPAPSPPDKAPETPETQ